MCMAICILRPVLSAADSQSCSSSLPASWSLHTRAQARGAVSCSLRVAVIGVPGCLFSGVDKKIHVRYQGAAASEVGSCLGPLLSKGVNEGVTGVSEAETGVSEDIKQKGAPGTGEHLEIGG